MRSKGMVWGVAVLFTILLWLPAMQGSQIGSGLAEAMITRLSTRLSESILLRSTSLRCENLLCQRVIVRGEAVVLRAEAGRSCEIVDPTKQEIFPTIAEVQTNLFFR